MKALYGDTELILMVLKSAAGYYIGRQSYDKDIGGPIPYARDSVEYWPTKEEAEGALISGNYTLRRHP